MRKRNSNLRTSLIHIEPVDCAEDDLLNECVYPYVVCIRMRTDSLALVPPLKLISRNKNKIIDKNRNGLSSNWLGIVHCQCSNDRLGGAHPLTIAIVVIRHRSAPMLLLSFATLPAFKYIYGCPFWCESFFFCRSELYVPIEYLNYIISLSRHWPHLCVFNLNELQTEWTINRSMLINL